MDEIHFVYDEELEKQTQTLKELVDILENPEVQKDSFVLKTFAYACAQSLVRPEKVLHYTKQQSVAFEGEARISVPTYQEIVTLPSEFAIFPVPKPITGQYQEPLHDFKAVQKPGKILHHARYHEHVLSEQQQSTQQKILIRDGFDQRVLVTAMVNKGHYVLEEPPLQPQEKQVLDFVVKKRPSSPEKGWKLIEKLSKKFNVSDDRRTFIKYYMINALFGLRRVEPFLQDQDITSLICDGPLKPICIKIGDTEYETNVLFQTDQELNTFLLFVATLTKSKLDKKHAVLDTIFRQFRIHGYLGSAFSTPRFVITRM